MSQPEPRGVIPDCFVVVLCGVAFLYTVWDANERKCMTDDEIREALRGLASKKQLSWFGRFAGVPLRTLQGAIGTYTKREDGKRDIGKHTKIAVVKGLKKWESQK